MRALACLALVVALFGCSRQPELTPEQIETAKFLKEQYDPRIYAINDRLSKHSFDTQEEREAWVFTTFELVNQFNVRKAEHGHEAAIAWYETESRKTASELIAMWGLKTE